MARVQILIVHDQHDIASELASSLTTSGYEVTATALSAEEAIASATHAAPDLLLTRIALPGSLTGLEMAAEIRRQRAMPVVFMGTEEDEASLRRAAPAEPYGFMVTPFTERELRAHIELAVCRHRAAQAVHELDEFFAVSSDMFCFLDFNGYFRRLNPAWERTLGFTREELMSRPFIEFVHPDDRARTLQQNAEVRGGGRATAFENRYVCKDGSFRWFLWNAAPQTSERVIYSVARDITARKQAETERANLVQKLESSLAEVKSLRAILPICMYCRKIRDDEDYWQTVESYILRHTKTQFSHGICPACMAAEVEPHLTDSNDG